MWEVIIGIASGIIWFVVVPFLAGTIVVVIAKSILRYYFWEKRRFYLDMLTKEDGDRERRSGNGKKEDVGAGLEG